MSRDAGGSIHNIKADVLTLVGDGNLYILIKFSII